MTIADYNPLDDTWVYAKADPDERDTNYDELQALAIWGLPGFYQYVYLRFDPTTQLPANITITSAVLYICAKWSDGGVLRAIETGVDWNGAGAGNGDETTLTWNLRPADIGVELDTFTLTGGRPCDEYYDFDVTDSFTAAYNGSALVAYRVYTTDASLSLISEDREGTQTTTDYPFIRVDYVAGAPGPNVQMF